MSTRRASPGMLLLAAFIPAMALGASDPGAIASVPASEPARGGAAGASVAAAMPAGPPQTLAAWARGAQIFGGMGSFHRRVTTGSPEAQLYFDQGMRFLWAFNHDEATRSFAKAAQIDPRCASCYWGVALTLGPNYNMPAMADPRGVTGWESLRKAKEMAPAATPVEQALIAAVATRYAGTSALGPDNAPPVLKAYAEAMRLVADRFPNDLDVQTLYAEALMNTNPWKLWNPDGTPAPGTTEIVSRLEAVMAKEPTHPGANHYYIHAIEASPHPEKALAEAERLPMLMPAAGHIQHMPAHIMQRVGLYEQSAEANRRGARADETYYTKTTAPDYYPMYSAHNYQFLAYSASMEGRRAETMEAVRRARAALSDQMLEGMPGVDWTAAYVYEAQIRFGLWDDILREPKPDAKLPGLMVGYLEARTMALAGKGRVEEAKISLGDLQRAASAASPDGPAGNNSAKLVYGIALSRAKGKVALAAADPSGAVTSLRDAVRQEDQVAYNEPADVFFPSRHLLGAALLAAGRPVEAETVYREDLTRNPENGWALYGLAAALDAEHRPADAHDVRQRLIAAWKNADTVLVASAY